MVYSSSTQPSSSDSLTHKKASQALVAAAACSLAAVPVISPGQRDAGLPADLTAIDEPPFTTQSEGISLHYQEWKIKELLIKVDIPLRGHRENEDALNKGNFIELFKFMCKYDPQIRNRLEQLPRNGTLMSPDIQNELLESAASLLLRKIKAEVCETPGTYYALLADEYKDESKRELVAVCVRYVHAGKINERAIGFMDTSDLSASGISEKILQVIEPLHLDPSLCVGFGFDGASVMSGNKGGVHVILKRTFPQALYVHCNSHRLNLVLCAASKVSGHVSTFFDTLNNIHSFMTGSSRHAKFVAAQKELHPGRRCLELERSKTRAGAPNPEQ
ncbi:unnamed protein product [Leuciscus chuanchicus]